MNLLEQETCSQDDDTRLIPLTQGQFTRISAEACERVTQFKWYAARVNSAKPFYAVRSIRTNKGNGKIEIRRISMARFLLGLEDDDPRWADHINGDTLDNTQDNLRIASKTGNARNRGRQSNNTSGFKGVSKHNGSSKWVAYIAVNGKNKYLGLHLTPELAHEAYRKASIKFHAEFARAG